MLSGIIFPIPVRNTGALPVTYNFNKSIVLESVLKLMRWTKGRQFSL